MLILIIASACLAGATFVIGQVATAPERDRRALVRRAAAYGAVGVHTGEERRSLHERVFPPAASKLAGLMLRVNRRASVELVQQRLLAAGLGHISPNSFLAVKGFLAGAG